MRKVFAIMLAVLISCSVCEAAGKFVAFPTLGVCTGDSVRYRVEPNTKADVWGRLNKGDKVIVEAQTKIRNEIWYEIFPPSAQDTAFISGKYLEPYYDEDVQRSPAGKLIIEVLQRYAPRKDEDYYNEYEDSPEVKRNYNREGWLVRVEAWNPGSDFGEIEIGDNVSKLTKILGKPNSKSDSEWEYNAGDAATFTFKIKNGKITRMIYEE